MINYYLLPIYIILSRYFFNPKPHRSGPICPHYFQRPITQKVLKCKKIGKKYLIHGKLLLNLSLGLCTPQKT
jgi:hypothetical protein